MLQHNGMASEADLAKAPGLWLKLVGILGKALHLSEPCLHNGVHSILKGDNERESTFQT